MDSTTVPSTTIGDTVPTRKMYRVEKFLPTHCPKCQNKFCTEGADWSRLLGDIVNGQKVIRETKGYVIIICAACRNFTAQAPLEDYQLRSKERAERFCLEEGFVNLQEVLACGNHCQDMQSKADPPDGADLIPECPKCRKITLTILGNGLASCECGNVTLAFIRKNGPCVMAIKCDDTPVD